MDKKSFIAGIKASIAEILERSTNKWVSVLEPGASFSAILAKNGLSPKITPPLFEVLTANGLIERLGDKSAIRYRYQPASQITPDLDTLAEKVFDANQAYNRLNSGAVKQKRVTPRGTSTRTERPRASRAICCLILVIRVMYWRPTRDLSRLSRSRSLVLRATLQTGGICLTWYIAYRRTTN